ncbi:MAG: TolC family outer membrane protein [Erythrobacter sp.]
MTHQGALQFGGAIGGALALALAAAPLKADTLRDALVSAYENNPTLLGARAQQRAVDEDVVLAKADGLPQAEIVTNYVENLIISPNAFAAPQRVLRGGPVLNVPIYQGGAVKNATRAAKERVSAGQADLRATESSIFNQTVAAYMDVLRTDALLGLAMNQIDVLKTELQANQDRFEIGDVTITDVAQAKSRLALAEADLRSSYSDAIEARETYIRLVGRAPDNLEAPPPLPGLPDTVNMAVDIALDSNPDLIAARERAEAAGFDTKVAAAGRRPTLGLSTNVTYTNYFNTLGGPFAPQLFQEETTSDVALQLTIPLFRGGAIAARYRQAGARESSALENVIASEREVIAQTRSAYAAWQASNAVIASSQEAISAAELSLEGVRAENSIGNRTVIEVLNAEQELLQARAQLVTARRNAYVAGFTLLAAMGRAEARDLNLETTGPLYDPEVHYDKVHHDLWDYGRKQKGEARSTRTVDIPAAETTIGPQLEAE